MKRKGIFIKIYFAFWLFTVLIVFSQFAFDRLTQSFPPGPFHRFHDSILHAYASSIIKLNAVRNNTAIAAAEKNKNFNHADASTDEPAFYVIDENGTEISGNPLPEGAKTASQKAINSQFPGHASSDGWKYSAKSINGADNKKYSVVHRIKFDDPVAGETNRRIMRGILILLVSAGVCYGLAAYISDPIIKMRKAAQFFYEGRLDYRIDNSILKRKDEFGNLANTFNKMAEKIESLLVQQRQLLGDISHELRSPLARMNVALEIARKQSGGGAQKSLDKIAAEAETLNSLIGEVLSLTKLESGIETSPAASFKLSDLIKKLTEDAAFEAHGDSKKVTLTRCDDIIITGNEKLLKRAVENVIRNAVKYSPAGAPIEISLKKSEDGTKAEIDVCDNGCGVAENELSNIFNPFYRISASRERKSGGSGLGLAISKRAVLLHGGEISAKNRENGGLKVIITLPIS